MLESVIEALIKNKKGRLEEVVQAFNDGEFANSDTHKYLAEALVGNEYNELANYIEEVVIPKIGKPMLPYLCDTFTFADTYDNRRRLRLLRKLKYNDIEDLANRVLEQNLPSLQVEAVAILADTKNLDNEKKLIALSTDNNRLVRGAAYKGLAAIATPQALEALLSTYKGKLTRTNTQMLVEALSKVALPTYYLKFLEVLEQHFELLLVMDKSNESSVKAAYNLFEIELHILQHKDQKEVYDFLEKLLYNDEYHAIAEKYDTVPYHLMPTVVEILRSFSFNKRIAFYEKHLAVLPKTQWVRILATDYFYEAITIYSKERLYDIFAPYFDLLSQNIIETFSGYQYNAGYYTPLKFEVKESFTDPRWATILLQFLQNSPKTEDYELKALVVLDVLLPDSESLNQIILQLLPQASLNDTSWLYQLIMKRNIPQRFDIIYESLASMKQPSHYDYMNVMQAPNFWQCFPKEYALKFEKLYAQKHVAYFKEISQLLN